MPDWAPGGPTAPFGATLGRRRIATEQVRQQMEGIASGTPLVWRTEFFQRSDPKNCTAIDRPVRSPAFDVHGKCACAHADLDPSACESPRDIGTRHPMWLFP